MFWWDGNAQRLWGNFTYDKKLDNKELDLSDTIVVTEGEMDCLAIRTAFKDVANLEVYSVPNGSPNKISDNKVDPSEDGRFKYVWNERDFLED